MLGLRVGDAILSVAPSVPAQFRAQLSGARWVIMHPLLCGGTCHLVDVSAHGLL